MEVYQQSLRPLGIDADQLRDCMALDQGHEVVAADEVKDGVFPESQQNGKREIVSGLKLVQAGGSLQQSPAVSSRFPYSAVLLPHFEKQTKPSSHTVLTTGESCVHISGEASHHLSRENVLPMIRRDRASCHASLLCFYRSTRHLRYLLACLSTQIQRHYYNSWSKAAGFAFG